MLPAPAIHDGFTMRYFSPLSSLAIPVTVRYQVSPHFGHASDYAVSLPGPCRLCSISPSHALQCSLTPTDQTMPCTGTCVYRHVPTHALCGHVCLPPCAYPCFMRARVSTAMYLPMLYAGTCHSLPPCTYPCFMRARVSTAMYLPMIYADTCVYRHVPTHDLGGHVCLPPCTYP